MVRTNEVIKQYKNLQVLKPVYSQHKSECFNSLLKIVTRNSGHCDRKVRVGENVGNIMLTVQKKFAEVYNVSIKS
jgi:hypothetical protein